MKKHTLKIYIDRLKGTDTEQIFEVVEPQFLNVEEEELAFTEKITVSGQAYLAKNHLILDLKIKALAQIPCSICNEKIEIPIAIDDFTHTEELCEIKSAIFDFSEEIRHAIILKVPHFVECHHGHCPHRKDINPYFKKSPEETYTPFSSLILTKK